MGFAFDSAIGAAKQREAVQKASAIDPIDEFLHDHLGAILSEGQPPTGPRPTRHAREPVGLEECCRPVE